MNIKKIVMRGVLVFGIGCSPLVADYISWTDKSMVKHENNSVSLKTADMMELYKSKKMTTVGGDKTRLIITQSNPCLCLLDGWEEEDYEVINSSSVMFQGWTSGVAGTSLGFDGDNRKCVKYLLGGSGCSLLNSTETWKVQQRIKGKWVTTTTGTFKFLK